MSAPPLSFAPIIIKQERYAVRQRPTILGGVDYSEHEAIEAVEYECIKINRKTKDNEKDNIQQGKESD